MFREARQLSLICNMRALDLPSGTVAFFSSDQLATMPNSLTYGPADVVAIAPPGGGWRFSHSLVATFTFRTPGTQLLVVGLPSIGFSPVFHRILVDDPSAVQIPALNSGGAAILTLIIFTLGGFHARGLTGRSTGLAGTRLRFSWRRRGPPVSLIR
jgi:hypothetical protein